MNVFEQAKALAHVGHDSIGQVRKYSGAPYWVHTDEVESIYAEFFPNDLIGRAAAHTHDLLEDVWPKNAAYGPERILSELGMRVLGVVVELTDEYTKAAYPNWNRAKRHGWETDRLAKISVTARNIKLCDMLSNTASIVKEDPDFARVYLREKEHVIQAIRFGTHPGLLRRVEESLVNGFIALDM